MPTKQRILFTEDDHDARLAITLLLQLAGYEVVALDNAFDALTLIREERFDLCLLDDWMPGMSGMELCREIRKFNPETPILFYSGAFFEDDAQRAVAAGAQGYLKKPVPPEDLIKEVSRLIMKSRQEPFDRSQSDSRSNRVDSLRHRPHEGGQ
jgi:CheY-like chemotaxis protein